MVTLTTLWRRIMAEEYGRSPVVHRWHATYILLRPVTHYLHSTYTGDTLRTIHRTMQDRGSVGKNDEDSSFSPSKFVQNSILQAAHQTFVTRRIKQELLWQQRLNTFPSHSCSKYVVAEPACAQACFRVANKAAAARGGGGDNSALCHVRLIRNLEGNISTDQKKHSSKGGRPKDIA